jgi:hypothetical protein
VTFTVPDATGSPANLASSTINAITQANPAVVTTSAVNTFIDNDVLEITGVGGMIEITDGPYLINQLTTTTFELVGIDSTLFTPFTTGGTAQLPGISRSAIARIHDPGHGLSGTPIIELSGVAGMTEINGLFGAIVVIDTDRFTIAIDSSTFSKYTPSGTWSQYVQPGTDAMDWTGEFDVPVRFDADQIQASLDAFEVGDIPDIPLVELLND